MQKLLAGLATLVVLVSLAAVVPASAQTDPPEPAPPVATFVAPLSGAAEVPPTESPGTGVATLAQVGAELDYQVTTFGLTGTAMAHVHIGGPEENGPVVATLFGPVEGGVDRDGTLTRGRLRDADIVATEDETFPGGVDALVAELAAGNAYVNVHTVELPDGAIRGQVAPVAPPDPPGSTFADDDGNIHERSIELLAAAGYANGTGEGTFSPATTATRGQVASFLVRVLGLATDDSDRFADDQGSVHEGAIDALAAAGITEGCTATTYCPNQPVGRGQVASFLDRALGLPDAPNADLFTDDQGSVHEEAIDALASAGITAGKTADTFDPAGGVRRDQLMTFIARVLGWVTPTPPRAETITVLHNNDGESALLPSGEEGGIARFKTVVDEARAEAEASTDGSILVSSGDNFLAGPAFTASQANETFYDVLALEALDYDAIDLGNHDFDFGPEVLADFIEAFEDPPPYLSSNLDFSGEPRLQALVDEGIIQPSTVVEVAGTRVGIVGATTPDLPRISSPRNVEVGPVAEAISAQVEALEAEGVDKIVLISHLQSINEELALVPNLAGVDIVIAGGGDELLASEGDQILPSDVEAQTPVFGPYPLLRPNRDGRQVPVVTSTGAYRYLGRLIAGFDPAGGLIAVDEPSSLIPVLGQEPDPALVSAVEEPVAQFVEQLDMNVLAQSEVDLDGTRDSVRSEETNLGNLIADSFLFEATRLAGEFGVPEPDIAILNGGGIRNDSVLPAGPISELDTFDALPFPNFLAVVPDVEREQVKELLENAVADIENVGGRFAQVGGFSFTYDPSGTAQETDEEGNVTVPGDRIVDVTLDDGTVIVEDGEVVPGDPLNIATIDFLARNGDSYPFAGTEFTSLGVSYQQALASFLESPDGLAGTITAAEYPEGGEGRITAL